MANHSHQSKVKDLHAIVSLLSQRGADRHAPILLVMELGHAEYGSEREEEEH